MGSLDIKALVDKWTPDFIKGSILLTLVIILISEHKQADIRTNERLAKVEQKQDSTNNFIQNKMANTINENTKVIDKNNEILIESNRILAIIKNNNSILR